MYLKHFALTHFPFDQTLAPEALFASSTLAEARVRLQHLLELRGIGLLTGEPGSGKTTLTRTSRPPCTRVCTASSTSL